MQVEELVTRFYPLQFGNAPASDALREQVRNLIVKAIPEIRWDGTISDGQSVFLAVLNDRVVLRHKQDVQEKLEQFLLESGMAATRERGRGAGQRGGGMRSGISGRDDRQIPRK